MDEKILTLIADGLGDALAEAHIPGNGHTPASVHLAIGCIARRLREAGEVDAARGLRRRAEERAASWRQK